MTLQAKHYDYKKIDERAVENIINAFRRQLIKIEE